MAADFDGAAAKTCGRQRVTTTRSERTSGRCLLGTTQHRESFHMLLTPWPAVCSGEARCRFSWRIKKLVRLLRWLLRRGAGRGKVRQPAERRGAVCVHTLRQHSVGSLCTVGFLSRSQSRNGGDVLHMAPDDKAQGRRSCLGCFDVSSRRGSDDGRAADRGRRRKRSGRRRDDRRLLPRRRVQAARSPCPHRPWRALPQAARIERTAQVPAPAQCAGTDTARERHSEQCVGVSAFAAICDDAAAAAATAAASAATAGAARACSE